MGKIGTSINKKVVGIAAIAFFYELMAWSMINIDQLHNLKISCHVILWSF
jgi:hypothetical protein